METHNHIWTVIDAKNPPNKAKATKQQHFNIEPFRLVASVLAVIFSIILVVIGIGWLSAVLIVLISGELLGYTVFFGIPPLILALLITSGTFVGYWPISLITTGLWSASSCKNKYKARTIITGAIIFSMAIATLVIIAVNLGRNINFEYKDQETQVIIDDGNICVSEKDYCEKY